MDFETSRHTDDTLLVAPEATQAQAVPEITLAPGEQGETDEFENGRLESGLALDGAARLVLGEPDDVSPITRSEIDGADWGTDGSDEGYEITEASQAEGTHRAPQPRRVERLSQEIGPEGKEETVNRPDQGRVTNAFREGKTQRLTATRSIEGGPVHFNADGSLIPPGAKVNDTATEPTAEASTPPPQPRFTAWARIRAERRPPVPNQPPSTETPPDGLRIQGILPEYAGKFQVIYEAEGIPASAHDDLIGDVSDDLRNAEQKRSRKAEVPHLTALKDTLTIAKETALVRRTVVVGVENPADLEKVARLVASAGLVSGEKTTWVPEEDKKKQIVPYPDADSALAAGQGDMHSFVTAEQVRNEVQYPTSEIPGLGMQTKETFAANREVPSDAASIPVAEIVDNDGNMAGKLEITKKDLKRHTLIAASSGAGKTVLLRQMIAGAAVADFKESQAAAQEGQPESHNTQVVVDFEKFGNYTQKLADQLAGQGLPEDRATVHRISPGGEGMRANVNLLRLTGNSPAEQVAIATRALTSNIEDPQAERVFSKFASAAIERAYEKLGWNLTTDKSRYPMGTPGIPDMEQVAIAVEEVMTETTFRAETKGDLGSFTKTELEDAMRGIPGQLFQGGYDIDWGKVLQCKSVVVIELGRIVDPEAKKIALTGIMRGLAAALDAQNPTGEDTDDSKVRLYMDETGGIFNKHTAAGRANAAFFRTVRGKGMGMVLAQQGDLESIHTDVLDNTGNFFGMQMNSPADIALVAERMGVPTAKLLSTAAEGRGLYIGRDMPSGPVRFATTNPRDIPRGPGKVRGPELLVDKGADVDFYDGRIKVEAKELLIKKRNGTLLRAWAELNAALVPFGRETVEVSGKLKADLRKMTGHDAVVRDCAITSAVTKAVDARPDIMNAMRREELTKYLVDDMLAQVRGTPRPDKAPFDLELDVGHFSAVKDAITDHTTARRLEDTRKLEEQIDKKLPGRTAEEQRDSLKKLEGRSITAVTNIITSNILELTDDEAKAEVQKVVPEFGNLVGSTPVEQAAKAIQSSVEKNLKHPPYR